MIRLLGTLFLLFFLVLLLIAMWTFASVLIVDMKKTLSFPINKRKSRYNKVFGESLAKKVLSYQKKEKNDLIERTVVLLNDAPFVFAHSDFSSYSSLGYTLNGGIINYFVGLKLEENADIVFKYEASLIQSIEILENHSQLRVTPKQEVLTKITSIFSNFEKEIKKREWKEKEKVKQTEDEKMHGITSASLDKLHQEEIILDKMSKIPNSFEK